MGKTTKLTTEEFIRRAKKVYGDKYDYSKVNYINKMSKVVIICPIHGEFEKYPLDFLRGQGCQKCSFEKRTKNRVLTNKQFIKRAIEVHNNKYDYSKVNYVDNNTKVCIICPIHGEFYQTPHAHLNGQGCPKCSNHYHYTIEEWVERFKKIHGNKYDYSLLLKNGFYGNNFSAICCKHGVFTTSKNKHLIGQGCPLCGIEKTKLKNTSNTEEFIKKAKKIHGNKYDYSKVKYINARTKVCIICPVHGEFWQTPNSHLNKKGCPLCNDSKLENEMAKYLINNGIHFEYNKVFKWLGKQHLDFYIPEYNIAIECQGKQHFIGWNNNQKELEKQIESDQKKFELCKSHNITICYYVKEKDMKNVSYIYENNIYFDKNKIINLKNKIL